MEEESAAIAAREPRTPGRRTRTLPEDRALWSFGQLLDWHLNRGTRPDGTPSRIGRPWYNKEVAAAMYVGVDAVRNWRNGRSLPAFLKILEEQIFGNNPTHEEWIDEFREKYVKESSRYSNVDYSVSPRTSSASIDPKASLKNPGRRIFVVHGHDEGARETVARFLERLGFEPIILHEQANQGRTIIEKVEAHGDVGFAVVLLTPDDEGCTIRGTPQPRARQNVLLELGYFLGRLGRDRVCALKRGELEIPSDFGGVVYEPFDASGGWKLALGRELRATGFDIDWNKVHE
jgi:predicted nucleotide-binding protein